MPNFHRVIRASEDETGNVEKEQVEGAGITSETPNDSGGSKDKKKTKKMLSELPSKSTTTSYYFLFTLYYFLITTSCTCIYSSNMG